MATLSTIKIQALKPDPRKVRMVADGQQGLYLRIYRTGRKSWVLRSSGTVKSLKTLGEFPDLSLAEARRIAHGDRKSTQLLFGKSTVKEIAREFFESQILPRNLRPEQIRRYLERDLAPIANKKVIDVTRADLAALLRDKAKTSPIAANTLLALIKRLFRFTRASGLIETDPASLLDRTLAGGNAQTRERVLTDDEIKKLWAATAPDEGTPGYIKHGHGSLIRFLLVTGQRIAETQATKWEDIDFKKKVWHIPKERTKTKREHWVALPPLAIDLLNASGKHEPTDYVFSMRTPSAVQSWCKRWCKREGIPPFTPHDLRRSMATRMNDLGIGPHIVERILNHRMAGVMAVYNRASYEAERIEAQSTWAKALAVIVSPRASAQSKTRSSRPHLKVVSLQR